MSKVTASEMDTLLLTIPRLTLKQLDRVDTAVHREVMRKLDDKAKPEPVVAVEV